MPQVLAATVGNLLAQVIGVTATSFLAKYASVVLLSALTSKLFGPKAPKSDGFSGLQVMTRSAIEYRKIVYGQAIVSGPIYYSNTSGTDNEYLWYCIALAEGQSEDLVSVLLDNDVILKADIDWAAGTGASDGTGTGDVSTAKWVGANSTNAVQIYYYLGDDDQPVSGDLNTAFADIGTNDRLRGVTHIICQLLYNQDTESVWKAGAPQNIRAVIKGRKIYDPRLDTTNGGSGAHRYADSTTWAWSENPSLCIADYLMEIMGVDPATSIDWTAVADTADDCEVSVAIPTASTEDRFTCNGAQSLGSSHKDNLDAILSSMDGKLSYSGGVWKVRASVWEASSVTITENDLAGDIEVRGSAPKSERFNAIRGFFTDPARNYESAEFPHISDATYLARDNGEAISFDLQLPMTNTATMAQRIAFRNLELGNNQITAKLKMNARGAKVAIGDIVSLTLPSLSWAAKTFRCIEWRRDNDGAFDITLKEDVAANYTDPVEGDYGTGNTGGVTLPSDVVPAPSGLAATGVAAGIQLTWTNPAADTYDFIEVWEDSNDSWAGATKIAEIRGDTITIPHDTGVQRYYWIRAISLPDQQSLRNPDSDTTTITGTATGGIDGDPGIPGASTILAYADLQSNSPTGSGQYQFLTSSTDTDDTGSWSTITTLGGVNYFHMRRAEVGPVEQRPFLSQVIVGDMLTWYDNEDNPGRWVQFRITEIVAVTTNNHKFGVSLVAFDESASTADVSYTAGLDVEIRFSRAATGIVTQLNNPYPTAPADNDGTNPVYTNTGGTHLVYQGVTDRTTDAVHSVTGGAVKNGLTIAVVAGTGVYSFSGSGWNTDQEQFTLRATLNNVNYDKLITITKAKSEAGTARITGVGALAIDIAIHTDDGEASIRVGSDGDVYKRVGLGSSFGAAEGTYRNSGVAADYEVMFEGIGTAPTGSAVNEWLSTSSDATWTQAEGTNGNTKAFTGELKWRDATTLELLASASATVHAQVTS